MAKSTYYRPFRSQTTPTHDELFVTSWDNLGEEGVVNVIKTARPALAAMMTMMDRKKLRGGEQAFINVATEFNPHGGWVNLDEAIDMDNWNPFERLYYDRKHIVRPVVWTAEEQQVNSGSSKIVDIISEKIELTLDTLKEDFSDGIWGDGGGKQMDGLRNLIPASTAANQTTRVGNLDPSDHVWHRTYGVDMTGIAAANELERYMSSTLNTITIQGAEITWLFCDQTTHEIYEENSREFLMSQPTKIADMTFELCKFKGIPLIFDKDAPSGEIRFVDSRELFFMIDPSWWLKWTGWKEHYHIPFQKGKQILCTCNLGRRQARRLACMFDIAENG